MNEKESILESILLKFPNKDYNWFELSMNPSISFEFIINHPEFPWVISAVSQNASVTEYIVENNKSFNWSYYDLCKNPNISFEFFVRNSINTDLNWNALSANPKNTIEIIDKYCVWNSSAIRNDGKEWNSSAIRNSSAICWNDKYLSLNPNINLNYIKTSMYLDPVTKKSIPRNWYIPYLSSNKGITERNIYKNVLDWNYAHLSSNPNLPAKYVSDNVCRDWNFYQVSKNSNISLTDINTFHNIPWDICGLSMNPNITFDYVMSNEGKMMQYKKYLLINPAISLNVIEDNICWFNIPNKEYYISSNPSITEEWIIRNHHLIDWERLSKNTFQ